MKAGDVRVGFRRVLQFFFALFFCRDFGFLLYVLKVDRRLGAVTSYIESNFLFRCSRDGWGEGAIVEIGSYKGRTTIALAYGSRRKNREKVHAVDPLEKPEVREAFLNNIRDAGVEEHVIPVFKKSHEAAADFHSPIRLLFIDGCHEYEEVKRDILSWKEKLIDGGIIVLHDYLPENYPGYLEGVHKAVHELILGSGEFVAEGRIDTIFFASRKRSENKALFAPFNRIHRWKLYFKSILDKSWLKC